MKSHSQHPKIKTASRPLFSCGFFRQCTQTVLSPTTTTPPPLPLTTASSDQPTQPQQQPPSPPRPPPPPSSTPPPHAPIKPESESSSSSANTSQSFTQWRFPLPNSPISHHLIHPYPPADEIKPKVSAPNPTRKARDLPPQLSATKLEETFHVAELKFSSGSNEDKLGALHLLEKSLVPTPRAASDGSDTVACPATVMKWVVGCLKESWDVAKSASKVLLALCLVEGNRHVAVEVGAVGEMVEAMAGLEGTVAERSLAALELLCTVAEGAAEVRAHAVTVPIMVGVMGRMEGRGKEYAISVLSVVYGGTSDGVMVAPPQEVARAVMLALQGDCSARGRRKGAHLLKILQGENGRSDLTQDG